MITGQYVSHNQPQHAGPQALGLWTAGRSGVLLGLPEKFFWDKDQLLPCSSSPEQGKDPRIERVNLVSVELLVLGMGPAWAAHSGVSRSRKGLHDHRETLLPQCMDP